MSNGLVPTRKAFDFRNEQERLYRRAKSIISGRFQGQKIFNVEWNLVVQRLINKKKQSELNAECYWEPM